MTYETEWTGDSLRLLRKRLAAPVPPRSGCRCGCGGEAIRPARDKQFTESCYRRWLRLGKPDILPPPDPAHRAAVLCRPPREPALPPASFTLADEAGRRVASEAARAAAYLLVRGGRDQLAVARVRERVRDAEAFWVLVGCQGSREAAVRLLVTLAAPGEASAA